MIVTASMLKVKCPRRWYYQYYLWLDPYKPPLYPEPPQALVIGRDFHAVMLKGEGPQTEEAAVMKLAHDKTEFETRIRLLETEKFVHAEIGEGITLAGRLDGICELEDGTKAIYELKTSYTQPSEAYWHQKQLDAQLFAYSYMTGIYTVVLDFVRIPSLSRTKHGDNWFQACLKDMHERAETYFFRFVIQNDPEQVSEFIEEVKVWVDMLRLQLARGIFFRARSECNEYNRTCPYWTLCARKAKPEDCVKAIPYEELRPEVEELLAKEEVPI